MPVMPVFAVIRVFHRSVAVAWLTAGPVQSAGPAAMWFVRPSALFSAAEQTDCGQPVYLSFLCALQSVTVAESHPPAAVLSVQKSEHDIPAGCAAHAATEQLPTEALLSAHFPV